MFLFSMYFFDGRFGGHLIDVLNFFELNYS